MPLETHKVSVDGDEIKYDFIYSPRPTQYPQGGHLKLPD